MLWCYAEFPDETVVACSDIRADDTVQVSIERPRDGGFDSAECALPAHKWSKIDGFSDRDIARLNTFLSNNESIIFDFARNPENRWEAA